MPALPRSRPGAGFARLWTAAAVSNLGDGVTMVAAPLLLATVTGSPALIAGGAFAGQLPWLLFSLISGVFVDRLDRRRLIVVVNLLRGGVLAGLAAMIASGHVSVPLIYLAAFLLGVGETLADTAYGALLPAVVAPEDLDRAYARLGATFTITNQFAAKPFGAWLYGLAAAVPFGLDAVTFVAAALLIATLPRPATLDASRHTPSGGSNAPRDVLPASLGSPHDAPAAGSRSPLDAAGALGEARPDTVGAVGEARPDAVGALGEARPGAALPLPAALDVTPGGLDSSHDAAGAVGEARSGAALPLPASHDAAGPAGEARSGATAGTHLQARRSGWKLGAEIAEGLRWLRGQRLLRVLAVAMGVANIAFCAAFAVFVLYARERLGLTDIGYGFLLTTFAVGGLVGAGAATRPARRFGTATILRTGLIVEVVTHLTLALTTNPLVAGGVIVLFGVHTMIWGVVVSAIRQRTVPDHLRGRVGSVFGLLETGGAALGWLLGAVLTQFWNVTTPYWLAAFAMLAVTAAAWRPISLSNPLSRTATERP